MALVIFLRGLNVGGHRSFRPALLARQLRDYDVVNVGAAGTFVVHEPGSREKFLAALGRRLPFETQVACCDGRELLRGMKGNPFGSKPPKAGLVRFVSILAKAGRERPALPILIPPKGKWLVRVTAFKNRFVFGTYRRHMKTIGSLGQIDKWFSAPATTRNWNTMVKIAELLKKR